MEVQSIANFFNNFNSFQ